MDLEIVKKNWNTYQTILNRLEDNNINEMLNKIGDRICLAPANYQKDQWGAYPGGIVVIGIRLAKAMQALNEFHGNICDIKSIYKIGLLHDIGRIGTLEDDWLLAQDSDWHKDKLGHVFKENTELPNLTHLQRTLLLLNQFQIQLQEDEFLALLSLEDRVSRNNLSSLLLHARNMLEKDE